MKSCKFTAALNCSSTSKSRKLLYQLIKCFFKKSKCHPFFYYLLKVLFHHWKDPTLLSSACSSLIIISSCCDNHQSENQNNVFSCKHLVLYPKPKLKNKIAFFLIFICPFVMVDCPGVCIFWGHLIQKLCCILILQAAIHCQCWG